MKTEEQIREARDQVVKLIKDNIMFTWKAGEKLHPLAHSFDAGRIQAFCEILNDGSYYDTVSREVIPQPELTVDQLPIFDTVK